MKKLNSKGFGLLEGLLIVVIVGLIGGTGYYVYQSQQDTNDSLDNTGSSEIVATETESADETTYSFKELGISMDILNGWEVKTNHTEEEGVNFYNWTVEKAGADGKISLSSSGFRGGFEGCEGSGSLTPATIKEVAATENSNLMFMSWSYIYDNETNNRVGIVSSSETVFRITNNGSATTIPNKDVKAGNYFFCLSEPQAGFSLKLNNEAATGFSRKDSIAALASSSSKSKYVPLPASAQSYADIKAMLVTIK